MHDTPKPTHTIAHTRDCTHTQDGKELPGQKGLNMSLEQWGKLVEGAPIIDALFNKA